MRITIALLVCLGLPLLTGAVGAIASAGAPQFYGRLDKPSWAPPPWLFGPVWTTLYVLMGIAAFLVWRASERPLAAGESAGIVAPSPALLLFFLHLVPNGLWSWLFFRWHLGAASMIDVVLLLAMIAVLALWFWKINRTAALLLLPYLGWVTFASFLTWSLWQRNGPILG